jgi:gas vesicle protein
MNHERTERDTAIAASSGFAIGMLCGAAVGAAVALLIAPRAGAELRGQVSDSANRLGQRARDTYGRVKETYDRASETVSEVTSRATDLADGLAECAGDLTAKLHRRGPSTRQSRVS